MEQIVIMFKLLDLFCGAGGCARGYQNAGFYVVGVDTKPQPHYCGQEFYQADALEFCAMHGKEFDAIHASPPCQAYTRARHIQNNSHPKLIDQTRQALRDTGRRWVIENVIGAPLGYSIILCGTLFDLRVYRHRLFESSVMMLAPKCGHPSALMDGYFCIYGDVIRGKQTGNTGNNYHRFSLAEGRAAMGIDWNMSRRELAQAIPPAYTEFVGARLLRALEGQ